MTFKEELQALIYKHLPPTSTFKDYEPIALVMHEEADRLDLEAEIFFIGWDEETAWNAMKDGDSDPVPSATQAEAGITPGSDYDWGEIQKRRWGTDEIMIGI